MSSTSSITPTTSEEMEILQAKRAYNRESASRARKRRKTIVAELQKKIEDLTEDKAVLRRSLKVMENQLRALEKLTEARTNTIVDELMFTTCHRNNNSHRNIDCFISQQQVSPTSKHEDLGRLVRPKLPVLPFGDQNEWFRFQSNY